MGCEVTFGTTLFGGGEVEEVEAEGLGSTPAVYFQVVDDIKRRRRLGKVAAKSKSNSIPYGIALLDF